MRVSLRSKPVELALLLDDLINGGGFSTPLFPQVVDILCFQLISHSDRLTFLAGLRLTLFGLQNGLFRAAWSSKQDVGGCLLAGLDGLLSQLHTPICEGMVKPDSKLLTQTLFVEFWKTSLAWRPGSLKASHLRRGGLGIKSGPVVIMQRSHSGLGLSELFRQIVMVFCRPKDPQGNARVAYPSLVTAYCMGLHHLDR